MKRVLRFAAPVLIFAGSLVGAVAGSVTITTPTAWSKTDVPPDPTITFGTLPNGMRYLIKPNTHPEHGVSFFLRIATGSFNETAKTAGISHFIEHMSFRGTTHIPDGEAFKRLQQIGVGLGSDSNAFTMADSTVYTFDFPGNDAATLDTALTLTRDIASEILFDPKAVDSERHVVLSEYRLRDTAQLRMARASYKAMYGDKLADAYIALGSEAAIKAASADDLKAYYRTYYRPDRAVLIVVGDIDPKTVEAEIKKRFADWKATGPKPADPTFTTPDPPKAAEVRLFTEDGANSAVQMTWVSPFDPTPETRARDIRDTVRDLALRILNQRLHKLATSGDPPFLSAGASAADNDRTSFVASIGASVGKGDPKRAIKALRQTLMTILHDGVGQEEVDRAIEQQRVLVTTSVTAAASRKNNNLTGFFSSAVGKDAVIDAPENWTPTFEAAVKNLTAAQITAILRELFLNAQPLVIVASPTPVEGGADALLAAYNEAGTLQQAVAETKPVVWPYTDFGPAGTITSQSRIDDLDVTTATFANGVRVLIKPTKLQEGQLQIMIRIGHGIQGTPRGKTAPRWAVGGAWGLGGVNRIATPDLPQALSGRQWGAHPDLAEGAFQIMAQTRPADLIPELQFIAAFVTDPAWRPEGLAQIKSASETGLAQAMTTPGGLYSLHYWEYLHNGDQRWSPPTLDGIKSTDLASIKALIADDLKSGPMEIIIVGDITVDAALEGVKRTFGAIAKRKVDTKPFAANEDMPKGGAAPLVLRHKGKSQEALAMLGWKTTSMFPDTQTPRVLRVLEAVMRSRLFDELRTKEGITYTPQTSSANSWATPGWGVLSVTATVPADKLADFYAAAKKVANDLATTEVSPDEFERARGPLVTEAEHARENNAYWLYELGGVAAEPRALDLIRNRVSGLKAVTAADVQKAAQNFLKDDRSLRMIVVPEDFKVPDALP
jgi:Predicted Zn-dependent peptidases